MYLIKQIIKKIFENFGYKITKFENIQFEELQDLVKSLKIRNINLLLDIGANKGQFALNLRKAGYDGKIISFEPLPKEHKILQTLSKFDDNWIIFKRCAIGKKKQKIRINYSLNSVSSSILEIQKDHIRSELNSRYIDSYEVEQEKLDDYLRYFLSFKEKIMIKIDTQGYEMEVLEGAKNLIEKTQGIQCEFSLTNLYQGQPNWKDLFKYIERKKFYIWTIKEGFNDIYTGKTHQVDITFFR